jgi:hypothetical protein
MKYDPKRWTPEWKAHMNSERVQAAHRDIIKRIKIYKDKKREQHERNARD